MFGIFKYLENFTADNDGDLFWLRETGDGGELGVSLLFPLQELCDVLFPLLGILVRCGFRIEGEAKQFDL